MSMTFDTSLAAQPIAHDGRIPNASQLEQPNPEESSVAERRRGLHARFVNLLCSLISAATRPFSRFARQSLHPSTTNRYLFVLRFRVWPLTHFAVAHTLNYGFPSRIPWLFIAE